jgi:hypothetical protein
MAGIIPKAFATHLFQSLVPMIEADGFHGKPWDWKKLLDPAIFCINFQPRSDRKACCINLGVHFSFLPIAGESQVAANIEAITAVNCEIKKRLAPANEVDHWWVFSDPASIRDLAQCYATCALPFFAGYSNFPRPFLDISPSDVSTDRANFIFPMMTKARRLLFLARVHNFLVNRELAVAFCEKGIETAGMASLLRPTFQEILKKNK